MSETHRKLFSTWNSKVRFWSASLQLSLSLLILYAVAFFIKSSERNGIDILCKTRYTDVRACCCFCTIKFFVWIFISLVLWAKFRFFFTHWLRSYKKPHNEGNSIHTALFLYNISTDVNMTKWFTVNSFEFIHTFSLKTLQYHFFFKFMTFAALNFFIIIITLGSSVSYEILISSDEKLELFEILIIFFSVILV